MSLLSAINQSVGALNVAQIGLQVVGNNIANANTPGYIRQELVQTAGEAIRLGGLLQGTGVRPLGVVQQIDKALAERLRHAASALATNQDLDGAYSQLEALVDELGDSDLSTQLSSFNSSLHDLANQPGDYALKQLVVLQGQTLAEHVNRLGDRATEFIQASDGDLSGHIDEVNRLTSKIAKLNIRIVDIEGGRTLGSDATGLRDEREAALNELSTYLAIDTQEQATGSVSVFVGGDFIVADGFAREAYARRISDDPLEGSEIRLVETDAPLNATGGKLGGASAARDEVYGGFLTDLNALAAGLAETFNRVHSQGKGTTGYSNLTSLVAVDPSVRVDNAALDFAPENGAFDIQIFGQTNELLETHRIQIDLFSDGSGTTVADVAEQIDSVDGLAASITSDGRLQIAADVSGSTFGFAQDTSGFLAAAGINTFFTGTTATTIGINQLVTESPEYLAISNAGIGTDVDNLTQLVDLIDRPLDHLGSVSLRDRYQQMVTTITQDASVQNTVTEGLQTYHDTLLGDHLAITSVNIDEEAIKMVYLQRAFQASSRVISTASEMLDVLINL